MSETPLSAAFQLQREVIRQTETVAEEIVRLPTEVGGLFAEGAGTQRELQEQAFELSRQSIYRSLDAVESVAGGEDVEPLREAVDRAFETLQDRQEQAVEVIGSESDTVNEDLLAQLTDQADLLIEFNEQIEQQLVELLEDLPDNAAVPEEFTSEFESQLAAITEQFTEQLDAVGGFDTAASDSDPTEIEIESADRGGVTDSDGEE